MRKETWNTFKHAPAGATAGEIVKTASTGEQLEITVRDSEQAVLDYAAAGRLGMVIEPNRTFGYPEVVDSLRKNGFALTSRTFAGRRRALERTVTWTKAGRTWKIPITLSDTVWLDIEQADACGWPTVSRWYRDKQEVPYRHLFGWLVADGWTEQADLGEAMSTAAPAVRGRNWERERDDDVLSVALADDGMMNRPSELVIYGPGFEAGIDGKLGDWTIVTALATLGMDDERITSASWTSPPGWAQDSPAVVLDREGRFAVATGAGWYAYALTPEQESPQVYTPRQLEDLYGPITVFLDGNGERV